MLSQIHRLGISSLFGFNIYTIAPALLLLTVGCLTFFYSLSFSNNKLVNLLIPSTLIGSIIAVFSSNYIITFIALELLSGTCFLLILTSNKMIRRIAIRYFLIHSIGGVIMITGIMWHFYLEKNFLIYKTLSSPAEYLILLSFVINVALFPFMGWYTKTYSRADAFSLVLLSAITTKSAFFVMWKAIPGSSLIFCIGFTTLIISSLLSFMTKNVLKYLLLVSCASSGFMVMAISYHSFQMTENISEQINSQLIFYISSSVISICGFLTLYGFLAYHECKSNTFNSLKKYFTEHGSSIHFLIPALIFGIFLMAFPFTPAFFAKNTITKFFVQEKLFYTAFKISSVLFIIFGAKLITPLFHTIEFLKLDTRGKKLAATLYSFAFLLLGLAMICFFSLKIKYSIFTISVEFFSFTAYTFIAICMLFLMEGLLKALKLKKFIKIVFHMIRSAKIQGMNSIKKVNAACKSYLEICDNKKLLKFLPVFPKITPSFGIGSIIFVLSICLIINNV